jgi:hypothetical protein
MAQGQTLTRLAEDGCVFRKSRLSLDTLASTFPKRSNILCDLRKLKCNRQHNKRTRVTLRDRNTPLTSVGVQSYQLQCKRAIRKWPLVQTSAHLPSRSCVRELGSSIRNFWNNENIPKSRPTTWRRNNKPHMTVCEDILSAVCRATIRDSRIFSNDFNCFGTYQRDQFLSRVEVQHLA